VRRALAVAVAAAALAVPAVAHAASTVRTFAVGPRISPDWIDTRAHFHDKLLALVDARERGRPGVPAVQSGAGDVASHLAPGGAAANLVALPEDLGLLAAFTGSRGDGARAASGLVDAVIALIGSYAPVSGYYAAKYPQLTKRPLPTRLLAVSLTDTFGRVAVETFAELADRLDVTLVAGVNMARSWRIVCTSKATFHPPPGAAGCDVEDPALVARLRSPDEPERDYAYEATTPDAVNMALVFGPDGRIIGKQVKAYLTPIELPSQLDLKPGSIAEVHAIPTPAGRLGIATSKDAWMPDVLDRLEADGAQLLVQPEFFVGDTVGLDGMWAPDNLRAAGYADVLRHQGLAAVVLPSMTGNLFDFSADAQSHIAVKPTVAGRGPAGALVGQEPAPGFAAVMAFGVPDPVGEPLVARRQTLAASAVLQLPRPDNPACPSIEPGPCRGGQVEGTVFHDVTVGPRRVRAGRIAATGPFSAARAISPTLAGQANVALAARGRLVVAAWEEAGHVLLARSTDAGRTWRPAHVIGHGRSPSVAVGARRRVWLAMVQRRGVVVRTSDDAGRRFGAGSTASPGRGRQLGPSIAATTGGDAYLAWIDERGRQPDGSGLPRAAVYGAPVRDNRVGPPRLLDNAAAKVADAKALDNDWSVSVGARGRAVTVAWSDFSTYDWRIVARGSSDGGHRRFGALRTISANPADREALDDAPSVAVGRDGAHVAWTNYTKAPTLDPAQSYQVALDRRMLAGDARSIAVNPALALAPSGTPLVAFQDHTDGVAAIRLSARGRSRTVSASPASQWRPAIAVSAGHVLIAWADARGRSPQIRLARAPLHAVI
jgi:predicted amidohydrolase